VETEPEFPDEHIRVITSPIEVLEVRSAARADFVDLLEKRGFTLLPETVNQWWPA
jgi:hypothetical protein